MGGVWIEGGGRVVWADEMGVVVWGSDMGVVVWVTNIGVVLVMVVASLNWMGGTLILLFGSDGRDGHCARGRRLQVAVGGTVV